MKNTLAVMSVVFLAACGGAPPVPVPPPVETAREAHDTARDAFEAGRYRSALARFSEAERLYESIDDARGMATATISQAEIHLLLGETHHAKAPLQRARRAVAHTGDASLRDRVRLLEARVATSDADAVRQLRALLNAEPGIAAQAHLLLCEHAVDAGDTGCVDELDGDDALTGARIALLRARMAADHGDAASANAELARALEIGRALAYRPGIAAAHETGAMLAIERNDREAARAHLERALYLRLWIEDRVHGAAVLGRLADLSEDANARERYLRWRDALLDEAEQPEWRDLIEEIFSVP